MQDLIAYLNAQIDQNDHYLTMEYNRERDVQYLRIKELQSENANLSKWIAELKSSMVKVDSAGEQCK